MKKLLTFGILLLASVALGGTALEYPQTSGGGAGAVSSVFSRVGDVVAESGDYNSDLVTEGASNLYFSNQRARSALSTSLPLEYDSVTGVFSIAQAASGVDGYLDGADWTAFNAKVDRSGDSMSGFLTLVGDPISGSQAATKSYVDALANGLKWKILVEAASTVNLALTGEQTLDDIALVSGDRALAKNQTDAEDNGCYVVDLGPWTRCEDSDTATEMELAAYIVNQGTANGGRAFIQTTPAPIVLDTTDLVFVNFLSTTYSANEQGLKLAGTQFSIDIDGTTLSQGAGGIKVADGGILDAQVGAAAGVARSKLALGTAARILVNGATGAMQDHSAQTANRVSYYDVMGLPASSSASYSTAGNGDFTFAGNLLLGATNGAATSGVISINSIRALHSAGSESIFVGAAGSFSNTGLRNVGLGQSVMSGLTTGVNNLGAGYAALNGLSSGGANVGLGQAALIAVQTGSNNTAVGALAGQSVPAAGLGASYLGYSAGRYQISSYLTGIGYQALTGDSVTANNTGTQNTAVGYRSLFSNSSGSSNSALGYNSAALLSSGAQNSIFGALAGGAITTGGNNTLFGYAAGNQISTNSNMVAIGSGAQRYITVSSQVAVGHQALQGNSTPANNTGTQNTAVGLSALTLNSSGTTNTAIGAVALSGNTSGSSNIAMGYFAGIGNTTGNQNTYLGTLAGQSTTTTSSSTFAGYAAGRYQINGSLTAIGHSALQGNSVSANNTGTNNTAIGYAASQTMTSSSNTVSVGYAALAAATNLGGGSTAIGYASQLLANGANNTTLGQNSGRSLTTGNGNTFLGSNAGYTDGTVTTPAATINSIAIGYNAQNTANNQMVIGSTLASVTESYIGNGVTNASPASTRINATGGAGTNITGAALSFASGNSTGTGTAGTINFQTSSIGASGSTPNNLLTRLTVMAGGTLQGGYMHNNLTDAQSNGSNGQIRSGTYTPAIGATTNISSTTPRTAMWTRVGNIVTVSGTVDVTYTTGSTNSSMVMSLPIPTSNFTLNWQASGAINAYLPLIPGTPGIIQSRIGAADVEMLSFPTNSGGPMVHKFTFQYEVI